MPNTDKTDKTQTMLVAGTEYGVWAATVADDDATQPTPAEVAEHVDRVRRSCMHPALELNGKLELISCNRCRVE